MAEETPDPMVHLLSALHDDQEWAHDLWQPRTGEEAGEREQRIREGLSERGVAPALIDRLATDDSLWADLATLRDQVLGRPSPYIN